MTTSHDIVSHVMAWFRFAKQFEYVCDELTMGMYRADVIGANAKEMIEIEVKTSQSDFYADFENKKAKHQRYEKAEASLQYSAVPNRFYFAVPTRLKETALETIATKTPNYGLIVMDDSGDRTYSYTPWKLLSIARSAKWIHRHAPSDRLLTNIISRMGSDLAQFHLMRNRFGALFDHVRDQTDRFINAQPFSALDLEDILK